MDVGLIVTFAGIFVACLAGVLGVWMERDQEAPPRWAWVFTVLIIACSGIEGFHSFVQTAEDGITEEALARVLEKLSELAASGDNPALEQFVGAELAVQARANPAVMKRVEKKVAAKGGDPKALRAKAKAASRTAAGLPKKAPPKAGKDGKKAADGKGGAKSAAKDGAERPGAKPGADAKSGRPADAAAAGLNAAAKGAGAGGAGAAAANAVGIKTDGGAATAAKSAAEAVGVKPETTEKVEKATKATEDATKAAKAAAKGDTKSAAKSATDLTSGLTKGKSDDKKDTKKDK